MWRKVWTRWLALWQGFLDFQSYRWERGSSCCCPAYSDLDHNPFHFDDHAPVCHHRQT